MNFEHVLVRLTEVTHDISLNEILAGHGEDVREPCECVEFIPIDEDELRDVPATPLPPGT